MPGPIPHALFALEHQAQRPDLDVRAVVRGAEFADIRRMAELPREKTHWAGVTMDLIRSEDDAWRAGLLLHNYLDDQWNEFMGRFGLVPSRMTDEDTWLALKLTEDRLLYELAKKYQLGQYFDGTPDSHELDFGVSAEMIVRWDGWVRWKVSEPYEASDWLNHVGAMGFSAAEAKRVTGISDEILSDSVWMSRFDDLHEELGYGQA